MKIDKPSAFLPAGEVGDTIFYFSVSLRNKKSLSLTKPTGLQTYQPKNFPRLRQAQPPINFLTYKPTNLLTYKPTNLQTYQPTNLPTYKPTNLPTYQQ